MSDLITTFTAVAFHFLSLSSLGRCSAVEEHKQKIFNEFISVINTENVAVLLPPSGDMLCYLTQMHKTRSTYKLNGLSIKLKRDSEIYSHNRCF